MSIHRNGLAVFFRSSETRNWKFFNLYKIGSRKKGIIPNTQKASIWVLGVMPFFRRAEFRESRKFPAKGFREIGMHQNVGSAAIRRSPNRRSHWQTGSRQRSAGIVVRVPPHARTDRRNSPCRRCGGSTCTGSFLISTVIADPKWPQRISPFWDHGGKRSSKVRGGIFVEKIHEVIWYK